ncbi:SDR family NAD(P)-dependent oxidoreductase [Altererythrobacter sp. CC-YST694]|uniref:SDR family NAD(P)-dependent oxidoreductase n=1 Tax=Altererythrobacter sp. CC-YST694 TaxID=2755038 RepID=UPI001D014066|nr:SDR family NAD(P)-dependent oxidoreductase [Altererythrobacter sp. CC-YST694]MCB5426639.1 SDR family NAD(P)-dependent oxidoreductase [Altererythrobacter sp. CC-YST694]
MEPAGKIAIVSGGNSGLGEGGVKCLLAAGATVISFDLSGDAPEGAEFIRCDVSDEASVRAAVAEVIARHGRIDILLNNAGIGGLGPVATPEGPGDMANFRAIIGVNLLGATQLVGHVAHRMMANQPSGPDGERGVIVNTCSIASFEGQQGMGAYTASKSALAALTLVWARDLSHYAIRVNGVAPGFMDTPMVAMLPPDLVTELLADNEFPKRAGRAEEYGQVVEFIIRTPLINGEIIRLDAGARPPARTKWASA